ncbi:MAG: hypothetical protein K9K30_10365 [Burkholderiaceae bacterium]|nr:hypothetical protein [Sulfuritalea sp.]MCF8175632.1 hypothetical protein [Burkholderiaceae bacterium]
MNTTDALCVPGIPLRGQATEVTEGNGTVFACDFSVLSVFSVVMLFKLIGYWGSAEQVATVRAEPVEALDLAGWRFDKLNANGIDH